MNKYTVTSALWKQFPDEDVCLEYIRNARWPNGIPCARCERITAAFSYSRAQGLLLPVLRNPRLTHCRIPSFTSLRYASCMAWFHAIYLMSSTRTGISAKQLEREIDATYKTALRMLAQIRKLMAQDDISLFGEVEVDETYVGGKHPKKPRPGSRGQDDSCRHARTWRPSHRQGGPRCEGQDAAPLDSRAYTPGTTVYTDELASYNRLSSLGYPHQSVQHKAKAVR